MVDKNQKKSKDIKNLVLGAVAVVCLMIIGAGIFNLCFPTNKVDEAYSVKSHIETQKAFEESMRMTVFAHCFGEAAFVPGPIPEDVKQFMLGCMSAAGIPEKDTLLMLKDVSIGG